jgi:hypothetical protein
MLVLGGGVGVTGGCAARQPHTTGGEFSGGALVPLPEASAVMVVGIMPGGWGG